MTLALFNRFCIFLVLFISGIVYAVPANLESVESPGFLPAESTHANWVFSGQVMNENGENYNYFFQLQRNQNQFHATAALFDAQTKALVFMDESDETINEPEQYNWHVGRSFLRFNAINDSWIFGVKTQDKKGFNFKVDMLNQPKHNLSSQNLRAGMDFIVTQTGQLNGHIQTGDTANGQFVTAKTAWFRQVWLTSHQEHSHELSSLLCRFNDGSGFYSMKTPEPDAIQGAVAGWFDSQGLPSAMSQFIHVKESQEGIWDIRIASPQLHFTLSDFVKQRAVVAGFIAEKNKEGFCMLSAEVMGENKLG